MKISDTFTFEADDITIPTKKLKIFIKLMKINKSKSKHMNKPPVYVRGIWWLSVYGVKSISMRISFLLLTGSLETGAYDDHCLRLE